MNGTRHIVVLDCARDGGGIAEVHQDRAEL